MAVKMEVKAKAKINKARNVYKNIQMRSGYEIRWATELDILLKNKEILSWEYEHIRFRIGDNSNYTPDFRIFTLEGTIEYHEVKGWSMNMQAGIKALKAAAAMNRYEEFYLITWKAKEKRWNKKLIRP